MSLDWTPLREAVSTHRSFLLMTHMRPDCDGLGSQLALAEALRYRGKVVRTAIVGHLPSRYEFIDPRREIEEFSEDDPTFAEMDCIIILDTGTWNQLGVFGSFMRSLTVPKLVIDHHRTQDDLGAVRLVDTSAEATGRLVYEASRALDVPISAFAAQSLFAALATDTGWFHHNNTTAASFVLAAKLVEAGALPNRLFEQIYEQNSLARLKLMGIALERLQSSREDRIAWTEIYQRDFAVTGARPPDTEELINLPRSLAGVEVALILIEQAEGRIKISFRSRERVDVGQLAEQFGGGGHRLASGAITHGTMEEVRQRVIQTVSSRLPP